MAAINLYERITPEVMQQLREQAVRFNEGRTTANGYYAISMATPYRKYYGLWRIFNDGRIPLFVRTLSHTFPMAIERATTLLRYCRTALTWLDNSFFTPYYGITYDIVSFGKYHGKHLAEVYYIDPQYVLWLANRFEPEKKQLQKLKELAQSFAVVHAELTPPKKREYHSQSHYVGEKGEILKDLHLKIIYVRLQVDTYKPDFYIDQFVLAVDDRNCRYSFIVKAAARSQTPKALSCYSLPMHVGSEWTLHSAKVLDHYTSHGIQYTRLGYLKFAGQSK